MPSLRPAARAIIMDPDDCVLLCRFDFSERGGPVVWAAPGGGVEPGETLLDALGRELAEEVGLTLVDQPPHVWHHEVVEEGHAAGYDGVINDYFLVRAAAFTPRGALSDAELAAENVSCIRWWTWDELNSYAGTDLFSPRDLPTRLARLLADGTPDQPIRFEV